MLLGGVAQTPALHVAPPQEQPKPGFRPRTLLGGPSRAARLRCPPSRQRIPGSPAPPPALGPPSPLPRWPSLCLNLLLILAVGTRPPPLLPSRAEQLRPRLGPGSRLLSPPPTSGTAPPPLQQPGGGGSPGAPGPARPGPFPGGRETCSSWPSVGECWRPAAGGASAGGGTGSGGDACQRSRPSRRTRQHPCCCAWPRACPWLLPLLGLCWGRPGALLSWHCRVSD